MKKLFLISILSVSIFSCEKIQTLWDKPIKPETEEEKTSYMLGYILSKNMKQEEPQLNSMAFLQGVKDNIHNKEPALSPEDINAINKQIAQKALLKKQKEEGEKHNMEGQKFLEDNKNKEGVKVTESGLQYEVLAEGNGKQPKDTDTVEVHYRGTLIDGTEFDSSYKRNSSISFPLNGVIQGWTEGLQLMKEGAKYKFYIPPELAYGERGAGESIPPHATLIFEVELLKVQ
ncbi:MAG: FKBP-type peptidyl-prolyl cis-trans isomerase [Oligoflexia bacterium]|nr:FKBP-type peptidyl-prolyl cis-trans isomerase [Oligoflexia bacterium]